MLICQFEINVFSSSLNLESKLTLLSEVVGEGPDEPMRSQLHVYLFFFTAGEDCLKENSVGGLFCHWQCCVCFFRKNGKLQFAASSTGSNLPSELILRNGNIQVGSLFIFSTMTVCLQFLLHEDLHFSCIAQTLYLMNMNKKLAKTHISYNKIQMFSNFFFFL